MRKRLEAASEEDLVHAAVAVVDAALCFRAMRGRPALSEASRWKMIESVLADPKKTEELFRPRSALLH